MTGKPTEWVNIFANHVSNKRLIPQIQRFHTTQNEFFLHSLQLKANTPIKKWIETLNRQFSKENIQMANRHMDRCLASLIIRGIKIKPQSDITSYLLECHYWKDKKCWWGYGEKGTFMYCQYGYGKQYNNSSKKKLRMDYHMIQLFHSLVFIWKTWKQNPKRYVYLYVYHSGIYNSQNMEILSDEWMD